MMFGGNDWIDLDFFLPTIKDAARNQKPIAWLGWLLGLVATALGVVTPVHWVLLGIGLGFLLGMVVHLVRASANVETTDAFRGYHPSPCPVTPKSRHRKFGSESTSRNRRRRPHTDSLPRDGYETTEGYASTKAIDPGRESSRRV
jgi:hypothetical protein